VPEIQEFIRRLPKAELHLHLEGTILPATLVELSARHDERPMTMAEAEALYRFTDFTGFIEAFKAVTFRLKNPRITSWPHGGWPSIWPSRAWFMLRCTSL